MEGPCDQVTMTVSLNPDDNISPLDYRYLRSDEPAVAAIRDLLTEEAFVRYMARVEAALATSFADLGLCSTAAAAEIGEAAAHVTAAHVHEEEARTGHAVRALVNCIRSRVGPEAARYVHLFATSSDIIDTANALRNREFCFRVLLPNLISLMRALADIADGHAETKQVGRTHGMFAEPVTFGFAMSYHLDRLTSRTLSLFCVARELTGKISGAVGAYNSMSLQWPDDPSCLEAAVLKRLGLPYPKTAVSSQISQPEPVVDLAYNAITCFGVIANLADDMRHLHRSEIGEVQESSSKNRVGSSTMPHKRNPSTFETIKSLWKEFSPRIITSLSDQISEHQRDLTNSASSRFNPEILASLAYVSTRMETAMRDLEIDTDRMAGNLAGAVRDISSEPLYIALSLAGIDDAHEVVRHLAETARLESRSLIDSARADDQLRAIIDGLQHQTGKVLTDMSLYVGHASVIARATAAKSRQQAQQLVDRLKELESSTS